ncbi:MAG: flagellar basal body L-ring protein FlgH [Negativicutes bacterium]|nr:flagellar basal body L-ring protein FlgH [Negativicutes bacterium]
MSNSYVNLRSIMVLVIAVFLLVQPLAGVTAAASLWSDSGPGASLFADHRARAVGDILTIVINENFSASKSGDAKNSKDTSNSLDAGTGIFRGLMPGTTKYSDSFKSSGSLTNSNTMTGRMTVMVSDIKPNGNLIITGTQTIKQNNEEQKIIVSGEVRPDDIGSDNTILSSYVANAQINIAGKGPLSEKQRQGILTQLFNFLF